LNEYARPGAGTLGLRAEARAKNHPKSTSALACFGARTLRVGYRSLKERVARGTGCLASASRLLGKPAFLELAIPSPAGAGECLLEWEDAAGAKMRLHLKGVEVPDLVALSRSFWEGLR